MRIILMLAFCMVSILSMGVFSSCAGGAAAKNSGEAPRNSGAVFKDVEGKEWVLSEIRSAGKTITIDRKQLGADNMGGFFTLTFREGNASNEGQAGGVGAPNRFFGPYTTDGGRTLRFGNLASTLMMAFREPEALKESEYFSYLQRVIRWDLQKEQLELYTSENGGAEAILIFTLE